MGLRVCKCSALIYDVIILSGPEHVIPSLRIRKD